MVLFDDMAVDVLVWDCRLVFPVPLLVLILRRAVESGLKGGSWGLLASLTLRVREASASGATVAGERLEACIGIGDDIVGVGCLVMGGLLVRCVRVGRCVELSKPTRGLQSLV